MSSLLEEHSKGNVFIKRVIIVLIIQIFLIIFLISRLVYLQIINFDDFKDRSENNRIKIDIIPPIRGNILDRNENKLTDNRNSYELILYKNKDFDEKFFIKEIAETLNLGDEKITRIKRQLKNNKNKTTISVLNNLTWEELVKLESNSYKFNNIKIEQGYIREYPYSEQFAHVIGYVSTPNDSDIEKLSKKIKKEIVMHPNFKIGKNGLESTFNSYLTGKSGYKKTEINAFNIPIKEIEREEAKIGKDIRLTLDMKLQNFIYDRVKNLRAGVVVLDAKTGEILSMVSTPSFDTNEFIDGISNDYWTNLIEDERKPMYNKTISALYAMGSTFKPIVAMAALENGWEQDKEVDCNGVMNITRKQLFRCWSWEKGGHGKINIVEAIERSCNIFFANIGLFAGVNNIYATGKKLGIGENFSIGLAEYNSGILPNSTWKKETYNEAWTKGDTINMSIGQGFILANPLQMAVMLSRIVNGGYPIKPFLVYNSSIRDYNTALYTNEPMFNKKNINLIKQGMYNVINAKNGTARWLKPKDKKYQISGKTGTAQVISSAAKEKLLEENEELEEKFRDHALFVGFAPFDNPKYVISVVVEHGSGGSVSAAPVAIDILKYAIDNGI